MYQAAAVWLPEILISVLNRGEQSGFCLVCFNTGERALIAYELGWHWSPAGIELCLLLWPLLAWSLCGLSYLAQSDALCELFNEPLKVWILCWQSVSYRNACQGIRVWYPAGTCDFLTASISAVGPPGLLFNIYWKCWKDWKVYQDRCLTVHGLYAECHYVWWNMALWIQHKNKTSGITILFSEGSVQRPPTREYASCVRYLLQIFFAYWLY